MELLVFTHLYFRMLWEYNDKGNILWHASYKNKVLLLLLIIVKNQLNIIYELKQPRSY